MGYKIVYENKKKRKSYRFRRWLLTAVFFALFFVYMQVFRQEQLALFRQYLIPEAVEIFVQQLQNGDRIDQAVDAFCQGLINGG